MDSHTKLPHLTFGFLIDWAYMPYHIHLLKGAKSAAKDLNINQIIYIGGNINSPIHHDSNRNILFNFIDPDAIDGLIISIGTMTRTSKCKNLNNFCEQFKPLPMITITQKVDNIPSVGANNEPGFRALMNHLLKDHNYKSFAFIMGTEGNRDAIERFSLFKNILKENNLYYNSNLIFPGIFDFNSGEKAVAELLDKRKEKCDVIVAANDDMALGVISALKARGINVPRDIAVVGFDNQDISINFPVPLTTVNQPVFDIGYKAFQLLFLICNGKEIAEENLLPTNLICRRSCGCHQLEDVIILFSGNHPVNQEDCEQDKKKRILSRITHDYPNLDNLHISAIEKLAVSLFTGAGENKPEIFLHELHYLLYHPALFRNSAHSFYDVYNSLHSCVYELFRDDGEIRDVKRLLLQGGVVFAEKFHRDALYGKSIGEQEMQIFRFRFDDIISLFTLENLSSVFARMIPESGIKRCFLSLYDDDESEKAPQISRLIFAYNDGELIEPAKEGILFPTKNLFPESVFSMRNQTTLFVEAVFFGLKQLGICVMEFETFDVDSQEMARKMYVDIAIKAALYAHRVNIEVERFRTKEKTRLQALSNANEILTGLYKEKHEAEEAIRVLNQELEKRVQERTSQLKQANKQLKQAQNTLIQTEKLAALGKLVAAIAHEINTPIGIGVTAASHMDRMAYQLMKSYYDNDLKRSQMEKYISESTEAARMVLSNLTRAYKLINSFKKIAVDQSHEEKRVFNIHKYLDEIFVSLKPGFKKNTCDVSIRCPEDLEFHSYPGAFSQIITNFVTNTLNHGFKNNKGSHICVSVKQSNGKLVIRYFDDGNGIPRKHLNKIYDPFFTTNKKHGGTGLGLHIIYNLVTQTFHGTITCISRKNNGTMFKLILPYSPLSDGEDKT